jgi:hypothetical protein
LGTLKPLGGGEWFCCCCCCCCNGSGCWGRGFGVRMMRLERGGPRSGLRAMHDESVDERSWWMKFSAGKSCDDDEDGRRRRLWRAM